MYILVDIFLILIVTWNPRGKNHRVQNKDNNFKWWYVLSMTEKHEEKSIILLIYLLNICFSSINL